MATGEIQRSIAREMSVSTLEANLIASRDATIDQRIDAVTKELAENADAPIIFDSRMAWHFLNRALRIRLIVDPGVAASRILGRQATDVEAYDTVAEVHAQVYERSQAEVLRFMGTYGVDITDFRNFDLIVDASDLSPEAVAECITSFLDQDLGRSIVLSPKRIVPCTMLGSDSPAQLLYWRPFVVCSSQQAGLVEEWLGSGAVSATLPLSVVEPYSGQVTLSEDQALRWESSYRCDYGSFREWLGRTRV